MPSYLTQRISIFLLFLTRNPGPVSTEEVTLTYLGQTNIYCEVAVVVGETNPPDVAETVAGVFLILKWKGIENSFSGEA